VIGAMHKKMTGNASNGLWMDALLNDFISAGEHELIVVTTGRNKDIIFLEDYLVKYYILSGGYPIEYNHLKEGCKSQWKKLIEKENPDIIQVWGSEFKHGLAALQVAGNIPSVIYIQGILEVIARYYESGIEHKDLIKSITFRDIVKRDSILQQKNRYYHRAKFEKEMFKLAGNIISENLWCDVHCKAIADNIKTHYCPLSINEIFEKYRWSIDLMEPYTIMCNASGYPLKGLHIIMKAVQLVKRKYPNVKLYIPGDSIVSDGSLKWRIRKRGYSKYIEKLISKLDILGNIQFMGRLTPEEMAYKMSKVNAFVVGSALENHSSTMKEAMMVGVPCISSIVGGVPEYAIHRENALLYRFEEYELLAEYICQIFKDNKLAEKLSNNSKISSNQLHNGAKIYDTIINIYKKIINEKSCKY
jgi:glycosyltransferase involved in cell wall biosynthesis